VFGTPVIHLLTGSFLSFIRAATQHDNRGNSIKNGSLETATPFSYGGGQINPNAAFAPGLIYNASALDYTLFLCALGYNGSVLQVFTVEPFTCPTKVPSVADLNYPSVAISDLSARRTIVRTVTNVGPAKRTYNLTIEEPEGVRVDFDTEQLVFRHKYQKKTFKITFTPRKATAGYSFGSFTWSDGEHHVRSPLAIQTLL